MLAVIFSQGSATRNRMLAAVASIFLALAAACSQRSGENPAPPPSSSAGAENKSVGNGNPAPAQPAPTSRDQKLPDFTPLIQRQGPAVVNVVTSQTLSPSARSGSDPFSEFFRRFSADAQEDAPQAQGLGSGFVVSADGEVLTNAHVVANADTVTVRMADGKHEYKGKVIGIDMRSDVALLKIDAQGLPVAAIGASANVKPGAWVAAIGAPFGFANTITAGIVSATDRVLPGGSLVPFIQTDVPVNPGNSGGPLLDINGDVIGINSMIFSGTGGFMGVSFAIPIEVALDVARQLQKDGKVTRGRIGVGIQPVTQDLVRAFKLDNPTGAIVTSVDPGGPASKAGVRAGDVILAYKGKTVDEPNQLPRWVAQTPPGEQAKLQVARDGERRDVTVTIAELPPDKKQPEPRPTKQSSRPSNQLGLAVRELPSDLRLELGVDYGVVVVGVADATAASRIDTGDVIVAVNNHAFSSMEEFNRLVAGSKAGEPVTLLVRREEGSFFVALDKTEGQNRKPS